MVTSFEHVRDNLAAAMEAIERAAGSVGRDPGEVRVVAVTKNHPPQAVRAAAQAGIRIVGENRVQEAMEKRRELQDLDVQWIMIGHLQRNKVRKALETFHQVHTVDSLELASSLNRVLMETPDARCPVLMEVNISGEASKHGVIPDLAQPLGEMILSRCERLELRGLFGVGPLVDDQARIRASFASLRRLRDQLEAALGIHLPELSMGMSSDYPLAVMEGSTMVRLGTCLFGPRRGF